MFYLILPEQKDNFQSAIISLEIDNYRQFELKRFETSSL